MKRAGSGAVVALLLGCTAMVSAQSGSSQTGGATDRRGSTQTTTPGQGAPTGTRSGSPTSGDQTGSTPTSTERQTRRSARTADSSTSQAQPITLTGCLIASNQGSTVGTSGAASPSSTAGASSTTGATSTTGSTRRGQTASSGVNTPTYMLSNASGSAGASGSSSSYVLEGSALAGHAGQQVEVRGTVMPEQSTARSRRSTRSAGTTSSTTTAGATGDTSTPHLRVTSVRMVSANCGGSTSPAGAGGNR